jgi:hypothetical protein
MPGTESSFPSAVAAAGGKRSASAFVEVRGNPREHTQHPGAIKRDELRLILSSRAQVHDHLVATLQTLEPVKAPAQDLDLLRQVCLDGGLQGGPISTKGVLVDKPPFTQLTEPLGDLTSLIRLEPVVHTARTQACGRRYLPDGQSRRMRRDHGADACTIGVCEPRGRKAEPGDKLLFAADTLGEFLTGFHASESTRLAHDWAEK